MRHLIKLLADLAKVVEELRYGIASAFLIFVNLELVKRRGARFEFFRIADYLRAVGRLKIYVH
jgi:hypothetical protein